MHVIAWSPNLTAEHAGEHGVRAVAKEELFATADVVSIHMPLSERSRGIVGAAELALMRPDSYLINTSRGPIVDEDALIDALSTARIAGAGLDVYGVEPLPIDHPLPLIAQHAAAAAHRIRHPRVLCVLLRWGGRRHSRVGAGSAGSRTRRLSQ